MGPTTPRCARVAVPLLLALLVSACGTDSAASPDQPDTDDTTSAEAGAFPVTIEHALGTAEIPERPERVVTWGWGSTDVGHALGVVPVAMPHQAYGGDTDGVLPWIRERVAADGAELPEVVPQSEEAPIEAIAAARPDVILAVYAGLTQAEHDLLFEIAPVVAYPDQPWATPWREAIELVGEALGRSEEAGALLDEIDGELGARAEAHRELAGKIVAGVWDTGDTFYVYKPADARVGFMLDLGLEGAPSVEELAEGGESVYYTLSHERAAELSSDVLVAYADTQDGMDAFLASPAAQAMAQVREGRVAPVVGSELVAAVSPPTARSLTWGLDEYVEILAAAARAAG